MKKLIILLCVLFATAVNAQHKKSVIVMDTVSITEQVDYMRKCFIKSNEKYVLSKFVKFFSVTPIIAGSAVLVSDPNLATFFFVLGGGLQIAGFAIDMSSHRWLKKAGYGLSGRLNGVVYTF